MSLLQSWLLLAFTRLSLLKPLVSFGPWLTGAMAPAAVLVELRVVVVEVIDYAGVWLQSRLTDKDSLPVFTSPSRAEMSLVEKVRAILDVPPEY